jgi:hypothetical protein
MASRHTIFQIQKGIYVSPESIESITPTASRRNPKQDSPVLYIIPDGAWRYGDAVIYWPKPCLLKPNWQGEFEETRIRPSLKRGSTWEEEDNS